MAQACNTMILKTTKYSAPWGRGNSETKPIQTADMSISEMPVSPEVSFGAWCQFHGWQTQTQNRHPGGFKRVWNRILRGLAFAMGRYFIILVCAQFQQVANFVHTICTYLGAGKNGSEMLWVFKNWGKYAWKFHVVTALLINGFESKNSITENQGHTYGRGKKWSRTNTQNGRCTHLNSLAVYDVLNTEAKWIFLDKGRFEIAVVLFWEEFPFCIWYIGKERRRGGENVNEVCFIEL